MLIAPIFHNNYLTTKQSELQSQTSDVSSSSIISNNVASTSKASTASRYNIFKTAINRGTELIKSTFLSKGTNYSDSVASNSSTMTSNSASTKTSKPLSESEIKDESCSSSSHESETPISECSSPDSIKTELMYFKPISKEARTTSSSSAKIMRIPSIRSTSSTSTILSPCPSPFFIPITQQRQSAFSFLYNINSEKDKMMVIKDDEVAMPKKITKRKYTKSSPHKKSIENEQLPKRQKNEHKTRQKDLQIECMNKTESVARETRSMRNKGHDSHVNTKSSKQKEFKSPLKIIPIAKVNKNRNKNVDNTNEPEFRRITRSMKN